MQKKINDLLGENNNIIIKTFNAWAQDYLVEEGHFLPS